MATGVRTSGTPSGVHPGQPLAVALSLAAAVVVAALVALAALVAVPPSVANLQTIVSDGTTPVVLALGATTIDVIVPESWAVRREGDQAVVVTTPDRELTARLELVEQSPEAVLADAPGLVSPLRSETLASGRAVLHADTASGGVLAAVGVLGTALSPSVTIDASTPGAPGLGSYRPALGELLEGLGR